MKKSELEKENVELREQLILTQEALTNFMEVVPYSEVAQSQHLLKHIKDVLGIAEDGDQAAFEQLFKCHTNTLMAITADYQETTGTYSNVECSADHVAISKLSDATAGVVFTNALQLIMRSIGGRVPGNSLNRLMGMRRAWSDKLQEQHLIRSESMQVMRELMSDMSREVTKLLS